MGEILDKMLESEDINIDRAYLLSRLMIIHNSPRTIFTNFSRIKKRQKTLAKKLNGKCIYFNTGYTKETNSKNDKKSGYIYYFIA